MARRNNPYVKKSFESDGSSWDTSANIYQSMMFSPAWKELTATQKTLYLACKGEYYGQKRKPTLPDIDEDDNKNSGNSLYFHMNKSKWVKREANSDRKGKSYELYNESNGAGFTRDMTALIKKGFIACVFSGAVSRTKSIYKFVNTWQKYGTDKFLVESRHETFAMKGYRKMNKGNPTPISSNTLPPGE